MLSPGPDTDDEEIDGNLFKGDFLFVFSGLFSSADELSLKRSLLASTLSLAILIGNWKLIFAFFLAVLTPSSDYEEEKESSLLLGDFTFVSFTILLHFLR